MKKTAAIKQHLLSGKKITVLEAVLKFKTVDLRKRISEFRREGLKISDEWTINKKTKSRYKVYFIKK